jgi:hypothetical protein
VFAVHAVAVRTIEHECSVAPRTRIRLGLATPVQACAVQPPAYFARPPRRSASVETQIRPVPTRSKSVCDLAQTHETGSMPIASFSAAGRAATAGSFVAVVHKLCANWQPCQHRSRRTGICDHLPFGQRTSVADKTPVGMRDSARKWAVKAAHGKEGVSGSSPELGLLSNTYDLQEIRYEHPLSA